MTTRNPARAGARPVATPSPEHGTGPVVATVAVLYDIHANLPALDAVLADIRQSPPDLLVLGGDVLPGPMPRATLRRLRSVGIPTLCIRGNGERAVLQIREGIEPSDVPATFRPPLEWVARDLEAADVSWIAGWPSTTRCVVEGIGRVCFCHATLESDIAIVTRRSPDAAMRAAFGHANADLVVCGHTHMQFDRQVDALRVVNAGSVGMPFAPAGAYWLWIGSTVELRVTQFDPASAAAQVQATAYPGAADFAARHILQPPSEEAMLDVFSPR